MIKFQTGGIPSKGVADNLGTDHSLFLGKELWITFFDTEKCLNSLWLDNCINCLLQNCIQDDILYLVYLLNRRATITVKAPIGDTAPFVTKSFVKQGTVLGPVLNNSSLGDVCDVSRGY